MEFYNDLITQESFAYLQKMRKSYKFILIGGWAVYLYSKSLKSKDIDIIVDYEILAKLKEADDVVKNDRLNKYEINTGHFDIDIYVPNYSKLGIEVDEIKKFAVSREGFDVPALEILFLMKLFAWHNRRGSAKGQKDELDIMSLAILPEFDWKKYLELISRFSFSQFNEEFIALLKNTRSVKELGVNEQGMSKIRKNIMMSLEK